MGVGQHDDPDPLFESSTRSTTWLPVWNAMTKTRATPDGWVTFAVKAVFPPAWQEFRRYRRARAQAEATVRAPEAVAA